MTLKQLFNYIILKGYKSMNKIYSYEEFKNIAKVGMKVKAVEGKTGCSELENGNIGIITEVSSECFYINHCWHGYGPDCYLELIEEEKTLYNLEVGDVVVDRDGDERTVLGVCGKVYLMSSCNNPESTSTGFTAKELERYGYKPKTSTPPVEVTELFGVRYDTKQLKDRIKELPTCQD